jgi:hypothetical protein
MGILNPYSVKLFESLLLLLLVLEVVYSFFFTMPAVIVFVYV